MNDQIDMRRVGMGAASLIAFFTILVMAGTVKVAALVCMIILVWEAWKLTWED